MREQNNQTPENITTPQPQNSFLRSRTFLVLLGFLAITVVLLWQEHQAHILGGGLILLLIACPLMHIFMHGGHGGHSGHDGNKQKRIIDRQNSVTKGDQQ